MIKIYGSMLCKDCVQCCEELNSAGVAYEFFDFADSLVNLKEFLAIRDNASMFDEVKTNGSIGIPCIVKENGEIVLDWAEFVM